MPCAFKSSSIPCQYFGWLKCFSRSSSALSIFNFRVEGLEFGACVVDFELPIDPALLRVTGRGPHGGFLGKLLGFAKPAVVQTLTCQRTQFVFRDVEPTAVL